MQISIFGYSKELSPKIWFSFQNNLKAISQTLAVFLSQIIFWPFLHQIGGEILKNFNLLIIYHKFLKIKA